VLPSGYSAIFNATTLVATVVGALVFAEAITPARVAAVLLGIGGVAVLAQAGPLDLSTAVLGAWRPVLWPRSAMRFPAI
jgi:drug/metabolite transporter (DMT)-like permease